MFSIIRLGDEVVYLIYTFVQSCISSRIRSHLGKSPSWPHVLSRARAKKNIYIVPQLCVNLVIRCQIRSKLSFLAVIRAEINEKLRQTLNFRLSLHGRN